ncbi:g4816 [Coccomyxa elongata]
MAMQAASLGLSTSTLRCPGAFQRVHTGQTAPRICRRQLTCRASREVSFVEETARRLAAAGAAAALLLSPCEALANEFDILNEPTPTKNYVIDDANVLNKTTKKSVNDELSRLETETGYRLEAVTVRKLEFENDAFAFGDKVIEKWYPTVEIGGNKGVLIVVTSGKDGALTGGPAFNKAVGDDLIDSVVSDSIPILTEQEKFNEAVSSIVKRVEAKLTGKTDPGPPQRADGSRKRTYKTKAEVDKTRNITSTIVLALLFISVVVPMLQYWGYTSKE